MKQDSFDRLDAVEDVAAPVASAPSSKGARRPIVTLDADVFGDVDVQLQAVLGHGSISVRALLDLSEGGVLDLDTPLDGLVDLTLNGRIVARGEIVAVGDKFGIRIAKIVAQRS
jgi:flagellar motor switch protein FliN